MIYLDKYTDSILPYGLLATPFETVFRALQLVAGGVWDVDPKVYRGAIAWGYYLQTDAEVLANLDAGRQYIVNILLSEQIPLIKSTQTTAELVELLALWRDYKPTFKKLEELYNPYAAKVNIKPITDAATQEILPVTDINNAFYVVIEQVDWSRPLTLGEATTIAERATPMGSRPFAVFQFEEPINVTAAVVYGDVCIYMEKVDPASEPPTPPSPIFYGFIIVNETTGEIESGEQLEELLLSPVGTLMMSEAPMLLIPQSLYNTTPLYFTANGEAETNNTTLNLENALYFADGTRTKNSEVTSLSTKPFAFMDKDNQFFMGTSSDELFEMTAVNAGLRCLGSSSSIGKAALLALFEPEYKEAYFSNAGSSGTSNKNIGNGASSYKIYNARGLTIDGSAYATGASVDVLPWTIINIYNIDGEAISSDVTSKYEFAVGSNLGTDVVLHPKQSISGYTAVFRVVFVTRPLLQLQEAYFTNQGAAATSDSALPSIATMYTAEGVGLHKEADKTYTIVDLLDYNGSSVAHDSADFIGSSGGYLIYYSNHTVTAYKITYTVS